MFKQHLISPLKILISFINALYFSRFTVKGRILPGFVPKKNDLVIDLGGGDKPFWRADVVLDNSNLGNVQRYSSSDIIRNLGFYIDSDIIKTPFQDKTFDFSFCSHVLEHVQRPDLAIKEIIRISKEGYVEVPNGIMEMIYPYQGHLWFVFKVKDELVFIRKSKGMHQNLSIANAKYIYLAKLVSTPFINFYWKTDIKYKIIDDLKTSEKFFPLHVDNYKQPFYIHNTYILMIKLLRKMFYKNKNGEIELLKEGLKIKH